VDRLALALWPVTRPVQAGGWMRLALCRAALTGRSRQLTDLAAICYLNAGVRGGCEALGDRQAARMSIAWHQLIS
jgi:hypothetical protein